MEHPAVGFQKQVVPSLRPDDPSAEIPAYPGQHLREVLLYENEPALVLPVDLLYHVVDRERLELPEQTSFF